MRAGVVVKSPRGVIFSPLSIPSPGAGPPDQEGGCLTLHDLVREGPGAAIVRQTGREGGPLLPFPPLAPSPSPLPFGLPVG